jgi:hypothetical protein
MEKLSYYQPLIKKILTEYHNRASKAPNRTSESLLAFDEEHDQYLWLHTGWNGKHRVQGIQVHIRIKDGKIWIEEDWTEEGIATDLLNAGIPNSDIVLGFHHPDKRSLTEFASV